MFVIPCVSAKASDERRFSYISPSVQNCVLLFLSTFPEDLFVQTLFVNFLFILLFILVTCKCVCVCACLSLFLFFCACDCVLSGVDEGVVNHPAFLHHMELEHR